MIKMILKALTCLMVVSLLSPGSYSQGHNPYYIYYTSNCTGDASDQLECCHRRNYSFAVRFKPTVTPAELDSMDGSFVNTNQYRFCKPEEEMFSDSCSSEPHFETLVNETSLLVEDILFGFSYQFLLESIFNGKPSIAYYCYKSCNDVIPETIAPDCYEATGDEEFCREYPVPISGAPVNVEVETYCPADIQTPWTISLSWDSPLHQNGEILQYCIFGYRLDDLTRIYYNTNVPKLENEHNTSYVYDIEPYDEYTIDNGFESDGEYAIKIFAVVRLHPDFNATNLQRGGEAIRILRTYESDWCPNSLSSPSAIPNSTTGSGGSPELPPSPLSSGILIAIFLVALLVMVTFACLVNRVFCQGKQGSLDRKETQYIRETKSHYKSEEAVPIELKFKEITDRDNVEVESEPLGRGQYGDVFKGTLIGFNGKKTKTIVAVKTPKYDASVALKEDFLDEIKLMIDIGNHPHIMPLYGCCTIKEPYYLITEFMKYGALDKFLRRCRSMENAALDPIYNLKELNQVQIAWQISKGMAFLSTTKFFHGDLAARNCLVGEDLVVKISDFGLSDDIYQSGYKRIAPEKKRPVKWYSPEANLDGVCSCKGDVWSFGIVMWEIYSLGDMPYPGMPATEVVKRILKGYRLPQPDGCPLDMYKIMLECWHQAPKERPTFSQLEYALELILHHRADKDIRQSTGDLHQNPYLPMDDQNEMPSALRRESSLADKINLGNLFGTSADSAICDMNNTSSASFTVDNNLVGEPISVQPIFEETHRPSDNRNSTGSFDFDPELIESDSDSITFTNIIDDKRVDDVNQVEETPTKWDSDLSRGMKQAGMA